tara:strand:+ start:96 stop:602 length:507 start_codon:yes stop_codon:yes gene_type:complete
MLLSAAFKAANPNHPHVKNPRRPRRPRRLSTSQAAIRRFEMMKRKRKQGQGTDRGKPKTPKPIGRGPRKPTPRRGRPSGGIGRVLREVGRQATGPRRPTPARKPWGRRVGPRADARPTGGGRRTSRTSQIAINRSKNRLGPTPSKGRKRTTSQSAIARFKAMRGRRRR